MLQLCEQSEISSSGLFVVPERQLIIIGQMNFNFCHNLTVILKVLTIFCINSIFAKVLPDGWTQFFWGNSNFATRFEFSSLDSYIFWLKCFVHLKSIWLKLTLQEFEKNDYFWNYFFLKCGLDLFSIFMAMTTKNQN